MPDHLLLPPGALPPRAPQGPLPIAGFPSLARTGMGARIETGRLNGLQHSNVQTYVSNLPVSRLCGQVRSICQDIFSGQDINWTGIPMARSRWQRLVGVNRPICTRRASRMMTLILLLSCPFNLWPAQKIWLFQLFAAPRWSPRFLVVDYLAGFE